MLSAIFGFFRKLFGKKPEPPVQEEPVIWKEISVSVSAAEPEHPEIIIDVADRIRKTQKEKNTQRQQHRKQRKTVEKRTASVTGKTGVRLLSKKDDFAALFDVPLEKEKAVGSENFDEIIRQKEEVIEKTPTMRQRLKKYPPPVEELDLHGCTSGQSVIKTDAFVRTALGSGLRTVRIIVGKGLHSEGKAVLRDVVEDKLVGLKRDGLILNFVWEKTSKLKSGAMIVYLVPDNAKGET